MTESTESTGGGARGATSVAGDGAAPTTKATAAPRRSWPEPRYRGPSDLRLGPKGAARRRAHDGDDDRPRGRLEYRRWRVEAAAAIGSASGKAYGVVKTSAVTRIRTRGAARIQRRRSRVLGWPRATAVLTEAAPELGRRWIRASRARQGWRRGADFAHRGSAGLWLGAFDAARRRASNGGGRSGWNG